MEAVSISLSLTLSSVKLQLLSYATTHTHSNRTYMCVGDRRATLQGVSEFTPKINVF